MLNNLFLLFVEFFKIGLLAIGGGMSTIPFLFELSNKHPSWFSESELSDMIAISESTPGPIGINMSTYCGVKVAGVLGGLVSTFSLVLPAFILLVVIARYYYLLEKPLVKSAFYGLKPVIVVLFSIALLNIFRLTFIRNGNIDLSNFNFKNDILETECLLGLLIFVLCNIFKKLPNIFWVIITGIVALFVF